MCFRIIENRLSQMNNNNYAQSEKDNEHTNEDMADDQEEIEEITTILPQP